ncbi:MAG: putative Pilin, type [Candidatus Angelobacter sp.]|nr:putative Pilin, type [Candidatus Angelobacter sp.]
MTETKKIIRGTAVTLGILVALAIIIPNVQRARMSQGGNPGASMLRTINTSEVMYAANYEKVGYAPNLGILGPANRGEECGRSHACLLNSVTSCPEGTGQGWCVKDSYRYNIQSNFTEPPYRDYWATATPIRPNKNLKNYCSGPDAVIRSQHAAPLSRPYTLAECLGLREDALTHDD